MRSASLWLVMRCPPLVAMSLVLGGMRVLSGCTGGQVRADDASVKVHRAEAREERREAAVDVDHRASDPNPTEKHIELSGDGSPGSGRPFESTPGNAPESHTRAAEAKLAHARAHEKAAAELESFESAECKGYAPSERLACPMMGPIARVLEIPDGVRLYFQSTAPLAPLVNHMRCHYAFAQARGFSDAVSCPLYIKGLQIRISADARAIEMIGNSAAVTSRIQKIAGDTLWVGAGAQML